MPKPPHGNTKRERLRRSADRCEVKAYIPPARMVEIAAERTDGMLAYYVFAARSGVAGLDDLRTLVRSAYMQAIHDVTSPEVIQIVHDAGVDGA